MNERLASLQPDLRRNDYDDIDIDGTVDIPGEDQ